MNRKILAIVAAASGHLLGCHGEIGGIPTPTLVASDPASGAVDVARTAWLILTFEQAPDPESLNSFALVCDNAEQGVGIYGLDARVIVNPDAQLPAPSDCDLEWLGPSGTQSIAFSVAPAGAPAPVAFDRDDRALLAPFPDDSLLVVESGTKVLSVPDLDRPTGVKSLIGSLLTSVGGIDGFSPLGLWVVDLPDALDPASLPMTLEASLDPLATVMLYDVEAGSPDFGRRVPFYLLQKSLDNAMGAHEHQLVLYPAIRLSPRGQYALVVTRRALVDPTRPLEASPFFRAALSPERLTDAQSKTGGIVDSVMAALATTFPPLQREDIAIVLRASIRSMDRVADDLLVVRQQLDAASPPSYTIDDVTPDTEANSPVAAIVHGTWDAPKYWNGSFMNRSVGGAPLANGTEPVPFTIALPQTPLGEAAPIVIYQHGNPGNAAVSVPYQARSHLAAAGFAVIGFSPMINRATLNSADPLGEQMLDIFTTLLAESRFPDTLALLPNVEQLGFLRLIDALRDLDVLPIGDPDGVPDLDLTSPWLYMGTSYGSHMGVGLLPFAPEIGAAALTVGGGNWSALLVHQEATGYGDAYQLVAGYFPDLWRSEYYAGISLTQMSIDDQDWLNRSHLLYKKPLGLGARPSLLVIEGLNDGLVPPNSTRTAAFEFGIPHLEPTIDVPFLPRVGAPVQNNMDGGTTAAFYQFVPFGMEGLQPSAGCEPGGSVPNDGEADGHYCAIFGTAAASQRVRFFQSALEGAPEIVASQ